MAITHSKDYVNAIFVSVQIVYAIRILNGHAKKTFYSMQEKKFKLCNLLLFMFCFFRGTPYFCVSINRSIDGKPKGFKIKMRMQSNRISRHRDILIL